MGKNKYETLKAYMNDPKNKERLKVISKRYYTKESSKKLNRDTRLKRVYGISLDEYSKLFLKQKGVCAICFQPSKKGHSLSVDHSHKKNKVRGLLCHRCNFGLGYFKDDPKLLKQSLIYLKKYG